MRWPLRGPRLGGACPLRYPRHLPLPGRAVSEARRRRGRQTELVFAPWLRTNGFPHAEAVGASARGADITGTPGISWEVKARRDFDPAGWLRQTAGRPGLSIVVMRLNGQGTTDPGLYPVLLRLGDLVPLLRSAGYGDAPEVSS